MLTISATKREFTIIRNLLSRGLEGYGDLICADDTLATVGMSQCRLILLLQTKYLNKLSVTVGMVALVSGDKVSSVKSTGPILFNARWSCEITNYYRPMRKNSIPQDTVHAFKAFGAGCGTDRLGFDSQAVTKAHGVCGERET